MIKLSRILGIVVAVLAWTAAALAYSANGEIEWGLLAAGAFFAAMPWAFSRRAQ